MGASTGNYPFTVGCSGSVTEHRNSGESTFTASDTITRNSAITLVTFTIDTNTFDETEMEIHRTGQFPQPVLIPNGTEIAGNGGTFELNPENRFNQSYH